MKISYYFRSSYLLVYGIEFIILWNAGFIAIMMFVCNDLLNNLAIKNQIFIISILIVAPLISSYGIYNIIQGTNQFEIQFNETNFKSYKNLRLEIDIPIEQVERVNIEHGNVFFPIYGGFEYFVIEAELKERNKFQLIIKGKKWILEFMKFADLLEQYCNERQIQFSKINKGK